MIDGLQVKIASYNVLAHAYVRRKYFPLFDERGLGARARYPRVVERVAGLDADVVCLQEVDHAMFRRLTLRLMPLGYRGRWAQKDGMKPDGVATFVRLPWQSHDASIVSLCDLAAPDASGHVALVQRIRCGAHELTIANVHFKWDEPERKGAQHAGYTQALALLAALEQHPQAVTVVCGDFNASPESGLMQAFRDRGFADAHSPAAATYVSAKGGAVKIDYVLHRSGAEALKATAHPVPPLAAGMLLPSESEPSDHVPIVTSFDW